MYGQLCNKTKRKTKNEMAGWRVHGPEKDGYKRMERQSKEPRDLEAYSSGGQGPPRAVAPSGGGGCTANVFWELHTIFDIKSTSMSITVHRITYVHTAWDQKLCSSQPGKQKHCTNQQRRRWILDAQNYQTERKLWTKTKNMKKNTIIFRISLYSVQ